MSSTYRNSRGALIGVITAAVIAAAVEIAGVLVGDPLATWLGFGLLVLCAAVAFIGHEVFGEC